MEIKTDDLSSGEVIELLQVHHQEMMRHSPPESVHALDLSTFKSKEITFWRAKDKSELAGCGALKELDATHGEIKAMRTATPFLRMGVAAKILNEIINESLKRGYTRLSLETGSMSAFTAAHSLYKNFGFEKCGPFAGYKEDPYSIFMTKHLSE